MKYFVEVKGHEGAFHVEIEDAVEIYTLMEQLGEIDDPREAYREGREVSTNRSTAKRIWGEEIDDKQLMLRTMKGEFHKKTAMSVRLPKAKKTAEEEAAEKRSEEVFAAAQERAENPDSIMTREEYDAKIPADALQDLRDMLNDDEDAIEETLQESYEAYLEEVDENA